MNISLSPYINIAKMFFVILHAIMQAAYIGIYLKYIILKNLPICIFMKIYQTLFEYYLFISYYKTIEQAKRHIFLQVNLFWSLNLKKNTNFYIFYLHYPFRWVQLIEMSFMVKSIRFHSFSCINDIKVITFIEFQINYSEKDR